MLPYCLKGRENTIPKIPKTKNERIMLLSKCALCDSKKSKFIKQQKASELLSSLGINTPLNKIPISKPNHVLLVDQLLKTKKEYKNLKKKDS